MKQIQSESSVFIIIPVSCQNVAELKLNMEPIYLCEFRQILKSDLTEQVEEGVN
jgi:hypothetical protein